MKNYYDELEINKNASQEVIERVYKVLAKKYHPDMNQGPEKESAEEKFKKISEAYEILSNPEKRKKYDMELEQSNPSISYEDYMSLKNERDKLNSTLNNLNNRTQTNSYQQNYTQSTTTQGYKQQNTNSQKQNSNYPNTKKKTYYYTDTGKPASAFAYYKYKIKQFFSNIGLILLAIVAIILAINAFTSSNFFRIASLRII